MVVIFENIVVDSAGVFIDFDSEVQAVEEQIAEVVVKSAGVVTLYVQQ